MYRYIHALAAATETFGSGPRPQGYGVLILYIRYLPHIVLVRYTYRMYGYGTLGRRRAHSGGSLLQFRERQANQRGLSLQLAQELRFSRSSAHPVSPSSLSVSPVSRRGFFFLHLFPRSDLLLSIHSLFTFSLSTFL